MKSKVEKAGPCRKILSVTADKSEVMPEYGKVLNEFVEIVRIDGFRKGRAPASLVEKMYGKNVFEETKDRLVPRFYHEAIKEQSINTVAIVDVQNVQFSREQGLSFKVTLDVAPDFRLPKYRKVPIKEEKVVVTDAQVDESFDRLRENSAKYVDVTGRPVKSGDFVRCDFSGDCEGKSFAELGKEATVFGEGKDFSMLVGQNADLLPGFSDGIVGAEIGKETRIEVQFPGNFRVNILAGKKAVYKVIVKGIRERVLPDLNQEFFKRFGVETEKALKEKIREDLQKASEHKEKERRKGEVIRYLLEKTEMDVPQSVVDQERNLMIRDIVRQVAAQGATQEQIQERRDDILGTATRSSLERVKTSYILSRIAEEEKIEVTDEEVSRRIEGLSARYGLQPDRLRAELEKRNDLEGLRNDIRAEKTLEFLLESAKIQ